MMEEIGDVIKREELRNNLWKQIQKWDGRKIANKER